MNSDNLWTLWLLSLLTIYFLGRRLGRIKRVFVPDYKRGVRFVNGKFANVLGPGTYQPLTQKVQIEVVDMRPQPLILERISYRDAWQQDAYLSVGAELLVCDAYLATTTLKNQFNDSVPIIRDALRSVASRGIADGSVDYRTKTAAEITQAVNADLNAVGMKVSNLEIIEVWSRSNSERVTALSH